MNRFYYLFESWFGWRAPNFGVHICMTFSDTFYLEVYNPDEPKRKTWARGATHPGEELEGVFAELFNLLMNVKTEGFEFRTYVSRGYTYRRVFQHDIFLPLTRDHVLKPTVIHLFGFGDCMMRVFDAAESHFEGRFFIDEALFDAINIPFNNKGSFVTQRTGARFVCIA
jgi:hypothetical protein